jgi:putative chitinase
MLTSEQLQSIMPRVPATRNSELLPFLTSAMAEFAIEAPARAAAFLAQLAHESGQFRFMEEIWGPTDAQRRYEPVTRLSQGLGNTEVGDGKRFKGRGPIQLTGRANYKRFGDLLDLDLVADPPRAAKPDVAFRVAGLYWSKNGLNELADVATADAFKEITRRINGGTNGLTERQAFYVVARRVLGVTNAPLSRGGTRSGPSMPIDDPIFERGSEAIRAREREPRRRTARPRRGRKRAAKSARKKAATRTRTRRPSQSSTSRSSKTRLKKKR